MRLGAAVLLAIALRAQTLPGTEPLTREGDLAMEMVAGIDKYLMRALAESPKARDQRRPNREELKKVLGIIDERQSFDSAGFVSTLKTPALVSSNAGFRVVAVRWPVLPGIDAEGLLATPRRPAIARVVAIPDADTTPEQFFGLTPGLPEDAQLARRLADNGIEVLVPTMINRSDTWSGNKAVKMTNQPHREWLHRQLVPVGRHLLGLEVQKVLAGVDWSAGSVPPRPIGVVGYGEGGLVALLAAAIDPRIESTLVSGAFEPREDVWRQPIYRSIWGQLQAHGDAELARLVAPRTLVIEASRHPEIAGPPPERTENGQLRRGAAPGRITTPALADVEAEFARAKTAYVTAKVADRITLSVSGGGKGDAGSAEALRAFFAGLGSATPLLPSGIAPRDDRIGFEPSSRQQIQVEQIQEFAQRLVRLSDPVRAEFWKRANFKGTDELDRTSGAYRLYLWEEVLGKLPEPSEPLKPQTRRIYDAPTFTGYEVMLPVWTDVFAYGVLLLPKDLKPGERRPVVVTQHGLNGRPQDLVEPKDQKADYAYQKYAAKLAERGFIVYAPQNPYIGDEKFRVLLRKANPLKLSLFSFILGQHQRTLEWLVSLPFVDSGRIGFYGLSYGGKTAMRVPSLLNLYSLAICSGDFNEWIWKVTSVQAPFSYMFTQEYDMLEWNLGNTFNYAEMAALIAPRPFMVERGHDDGVGIDEWVAYEYAKVKRMYDKLGIGDRTAFDVFNGGHMIHGEATFDFLHKHLNWPKK